MIMKYSIAIRQKLHRLYIEKVIWLIFFTKMIPLFWESSEADKHILS